MSDNQQKAKSTEEIKIKEDECKIVNLKKERNKKIINFVLKNTKPF